jgi:hypothetical protein
LNTDIYDQFHDIVLDYLDNNKNQFIINNYQRLIDWFLLFVNPCTVYYVTIDQIMSLARQCSYQPFHSMRPTHSDFISVSAAFVNIFCGTNAITKEHFNSSQGAGEDIVSLIRNHPYTYTNDLLNPGSVIFIVDKIAKVIEQAVKVHDTTFTENIVLQQIQNNPHTKHLTADEQYKHGNIIMVHNKKLFKRSSCRTFDTFCPAVTQQLNTLQEYTESVPESQFIEYANTSLGDRELFCFITLLRDNVDTKAVGTFEHCSQQFTQGNISFLFSRLDTIYRGKLLDIVPTSQPANGSQQSNNGSLAVQPATQSGNSFPISW